MSIKYTMKGFSGLTRNLMAIRLASGLLTLFSPVQGNAELADISTGPLFGKISPPATYRHFFYGLKMKA
jgi:hypothetical protein